MEEARELARRSDMIVFPSWEINSSFLLDQMKRHENIISFEDVNHQGELRGFGYSINAQIMVVWSLAPEHEKETLMETKKSPTRNVIFWNGHSMSRSQIYGLLTLPSLLGKK